MAFDNSRFTLMCFPQHVDNTGVMTLHIVFIPRNINPLTKVNTTYAASGQASAFVEVNPSFVCRVVNDPNEFAGKVPGAERAELPFAPLRYAPNRQRIYETLRDAVDDNGKKKYFDIDDSRSTDRPGSEKHRAEKAVAPQTAIRKYLPVTYRNAFNFTVPRIPQAVTDDSYACAMRDKQPPSAIVEDNRVSWGKVYAHLLRQPLMAEESGLLYKTSIQLQPGDFAKGGWIYATIQDGTTYAPEQAASVSAAGGDPFIKTYAARIPPLADNNARNLFAAVLFPVMKPGENPKGIWDELYIEANQFSDGFATIVHANQPVSQNLLHEQADGNPPVKEVGIRLGWEDEQILIWYLRQMATDPNIGTDRLDSPLGVAGYHIDVKEVKDDATDWESLNLVASNGDLFLEDIAIGPYKGELPYQVYPTKVYGTSGNNFWLPMYFSNWNNASLVVPDKTAANLYANDKEDNKPVEVTDTYLAPLLNTHLLYGRTYAFRIRMADISGGGPSVTALPKTDVPSHIATAAFKRYLIPNQLIIHNTTIAANDKNYVNVNTDDVNFSGNTLVFARPLLGFPSVVYTGKWDDPIAELRKVTKAVVENKKGQLLGIPDPDVTKVQIKVEVETLQLDNLASDNGKEHYITLYTTHRYFAADDYSKLLSVEISYQDFPVLNLGNTVTPFESQEANDAIAATDGVLYLPTSRNIRLTLRGVGDGDGNYWGDVSNNPVYDTRYGKTTIIKVRRESLNETNLLAGTTSATVLQGLYLQPDPVLPQLNPILLKTLQGGSEGLPDIVQRLGKQLDVAVNKLTLTAVNGERIQFWCSNLVRHTLAPDNSSITFANKNELANKWLVCLNLYVNRDWSWDGLDTSSFHLYRKRGNNPGTIAAETAVFAGDVEMLRIAAYQAIQEGDDKKIHREYTRMVVIDVVDVKPPANSFPDETVVQYIIKTKFKNGNNPAADAEFVTLPLELPTTYNPEQVPKLIGAGVALSPYNRNKKYSTNEPRQRYLWLELDKKPNDPNDGIFARVLAYAPDQLLSNNAPEQMEIPKESPLPIDPEYIRVITPGMPHEHSGLLAMQVMEKSVDTQRHFYLLPLPPGLHHESAELFGFFTYEFRYGHTDKVWSTAQGRFGRPFRLSGLQHPAPNSHCVVNRDDKKITVSAPYAQAVFNGKNVTSNPPRTAIWCLLYAQVKQADGLDYRNILLDEQELSFLPPARHKQTIRPKINEALRNNNAELAQQLTWQLDQLETIDKEAVKYAHGEWPNALVNERLRLYGLSTDSPLSVLAVEVYGTITNIHEHINNFTTKHTEVEQKITELYSNFVANETKKNYARATDMLLQQQNPIMPLTDNLGLYRILRTSPLTEVPFVCCTE